MTVLVDDHTLCKLQEGDSSHRLGLSQTPMKFTWWIAQLLVAPLLSGSNGPAAELQRWKCVRNPSIGSRNTCEQTYRAQYCRKYYWKILLKNIVPKTTVSKYLVPKSFQWKVTTGSVWPITDRWRSNSHWPLCILSLSLSLHSLHYAELVAF